MKILLHLICHHSFRIFFLGLISLILIAYTAQTLYQLWAYQRLNEHVQAQTLEWSIVSLSDEKFIPLAHYSFIVDAKHYQEKMLWHETYLNPFAAQEAVARLSRSPPLVWFNASSPQLSSIYKLFPLKSVVYTIILWMLGIYFFILRYCVKRHL